MAEKTHQSEDLNVSGNHQPPATKEFLNQVDSMKKDLETLRKNISDIERKHVEALDASKIEQAKKIENTLHDLEKSTLADMKRLKNKLTALKDDEKSAKENDSCSRMRLSTQNTLAIQLSALSEQFRNIQNKYKEKQRDRLFRQLKAVNPDAAKEDVDRLMETGGERGVFGLTLLQQRSDQTQAAKNALTRTQAAKNALADIQDRHRDILRLEQSLVELHELFGDMATLVRCQGEALGAIEFSVQQAQQKVEEGREKLRQAKHSQKACVVS